MNEGKGVRWVVQGGQASMGGLGTLHSLKATGNGWREVMRVMPSERGEMGGESWWQSLVALECAHV